MYVNYLSLHCGSLLKLSVGDKRYYSAPQIFSSYHQSLTREDQKVSTLSQCGGCGPRCYQYTSWYCGSWTGPIFPRGLDIMTWFSWWYCVVHIVVSVSSCNPVTTTAVYRPTIVTLGYFVYSFLIWLEVSLLVWSFLLTCRQSSLRLYYFSIWIAVIPRARK